MLVVDSLVLVVLPLEVDQMVLMLHVSLVDVVLDLVDEVLLP